MQETRCAKRNGRPGIARRSSGLMAAGLVLAAGVLLQGCREEEQGRILLFDKGRYIGEVVDGAKLPAATVEQLNERAEKQRL